MKVRKHRSLSRHAASTRAPDNALQCGQETGVHTGESSRVRIPRVRRPKGFGVDGAQTVNPLGKEWPARLTRPPVTAHRPRPLKEGEAPLHTAHTGTLLFPSVCFVPLCLFCSPLFVLFPSPFVFVPPCVFIPPCVFAFPSLCHPLCFLLPFVFFSMCFFSRSCVCVPPVSCCSLECCCSLVCCCCSLECFVLLCKHQQATASNSKQQRTTARNSKQQLARVHPHTQTRAKPSNNQHKHRKYTKHCQK